jgi:hypothetical protein
MAVLPLADVSLSALCPSLVYAGMPTWCIPRRTGPIARRWASRSTTARGPTSTHHRHHHPREDLMIIVLVVRPTLVWCFEFSSSNVDTLN